MRLFTSAAIAPATEESLISVNNAINALFPKFGERALDIPSYDAGKHMYLIDQYRSERGNRSLTYVGLSDQLLVEVTTGLFHNHEYINKIRAYISDRGQYRVITTHEYELKTHFSDEDLREKLSDTLCDYVRSSGNAGSLRPTEIRQRVDSMVDAIFSKTAESLDREGLRQGLAVFCKQKRVCMDFVRLWEGQMGTIALYDEDCA